MKMRCMSEKNPFSPGARLARVSVDRAREVIDFYSVGDYSFSVFHDMLIITTLKFTY